KPQSAAFIVSPVESPRLSSTKESSMSKETIIIACAVSALVTQGCGSPSASTDLGRNAQALTAVDPFNGIVARTRGVPVVSPRGNGTLDFFLNNSTRVYQRSFDNSGGGWDSHWTGLPPLPAGVHLGGVLTSVSRSPTTVDVFGFDIDGNLRHNSSTN